LIIINNSGTKQSWKKKTRKFVKDAIASRQFTGYISIIDYEDKFQGMLLRRLTNEISSFINYSDFEKGIPIESKKKVKEIQVDHKIKYYPGFYVRDSRPGDGKQLTISNINPKTTIFVEYVVTRRLFTFKEKEYSFGDFDVTQWSNFLSTYAKKNLLFVSKANLKKIKDFHKDEIVLLDEYVDSDEFKEIMSSIHRDYIFIDKASVALNPTINVISFLVREFLGNIYPVLFNLDERARSIIWDAFFRILNSLRPEIVYTLKPFMNFLYQLDIKNSQFIRSKYDIESRLSKKILRRPAPNTFDSKAIVDNYIYSKIEEPEELPILLERMTIFSKAYSELISERDLSNEKLFGFESFIRELNDLLIYSNMKNLSKEDADKKIGLFYASWLDRWQMIVDLLNKNYEISEGG
jgi:hypothetical protein